MRTPRTLFFFALVQLVVLLATAARADTASEASLKFEEGLRLYRQKHYAEALDKLKDSHRLVPNANAAENIALIYKWQGEYRKQDFTRNQQSLIQAYNWAETVLKMDIPDDQRSRVRALSEELSTKVAVIDATSNAGEAELFLDRRELGSVGAAPLRMATTPGSHSVIFRREGWRDQTIQVEAKVGTVTSARALQERITGTLTILARPEGARVRLLASDQDLGPAPVSLSVPVGEVRLLVTSKGFVDQARDAVVRDGEKTTVEIELQRAADTVATLSVTASPPGAVVRLAGRDLGSAPLTLTGLDPGARPIDLRAPGYDPWSRALLLEAGAATRVDVRLARSTDRHWRGWKWLGYGSGCALLLSGVVVGLQARSARDDFYANPTASQHDRVGRLNIMADVFLASGGVIVLGSAVIQLLSAPPPASEGTVTIDR
jgi:outer membrane receptor for ferrienterochelin and colicins